MNTAFDQDISGWNTGGVTNMNYMFGEAGAFDQDISGWDTSKVNNMEQMFYSAHEFDQNISGWDTGEVTTMAYMFKYAYKFDQDLSCWDMSSNPDTTSMFSGSGLTDDCKKPGLHAGCTPCTCTDTDTPYVGCAAGGDQAGGDQADGDQAGCVYPDCNSCTPAEYIDAQCCQC